MLSEISKLHLSFCYGDKDKCKNELNDTINLYQNCKGKNNRKVIERVKKYQQIISELN